MLRIGLIIQDLATDYSNKIIAGTKQYCLEHDIQLFVFIIRAKNWKNGSFDYQNYACKSLATKHNIDGILLVTNTYCQYLPEEEHEKEIKSLTYLPVVSLGAEVPGLSSVNGDATKSLKQLLNHLADEHGCKNIFFMGPEYSTSKDILLRSNVYKEFMQSRNQTWQDKMLYADYTYDRAKVSLKQNGITKDNLPFDSLVCCNDSLALGCIDYLKAEGIRVPEDVKITGFDNQIRCNFSEPALTSVDQQIEKQCYTAASFLHEEIENPELEKQNFYIDAETVFRNSCGCNKYSNVEDILEDRYFNMVSQLRHYHYFIQDLQAKVSPEKIIEYFKAFGIKSCVCCIYDEPKISRKNEDFVLPEKAAVYLAYNNTKIYEYSKGYFLNPAKNIVPEDFEFEDGKEIVVSALFTRNYQYGYMVYTPGEMDYNTYNLIVTTTGIALATNSVFENKIEEQEQLSSATKSLETETYFDEMTGVLNRRGFFKYAEPAVRDALERNLKGGIIFGDMDHLKFINDTYGHEAGDTAIKNVTEILKKVFRTEDLIARLGGDEFVMYACGLSEQGFARIKDRLNIVTEEFNKSHDYPYNISISLGYVEFNKKNHDLRKLMKQADENQYMEKQLHHKHN